MGIEVVKFHQENLLHFLEQVEGKLPLEKIKTFFNVYSDYKSQDQICIVGSLSSDLLSIDKEIAEELKEFAEKVIEVVTAILQEGKDQNIFKLKEDARTHAIVLLSSLLASLQLTRLTNKEDFIKIQNTLIRDLTE